MLTYINDPVKFLIITVMYFNKKKKYKKKSPQKTPQKQNPKQDKTKQKTHNITDKKLYLFINSYSTKYLFPDLFNDFDILLTRKTSEPAPVRKLKIRCLQLEAIL